MNNNQILRVNKIVINICTIFNVYMIISMVSVMSAAGVNINNGMQSISCAIALVITLGMYKKNKASFTYSKICLRCLVIVYAVIAFFNNSTFSYNYAFPIIVLTILYLDARISKRCNITIFLLSLIQAGRKFMQGTASGMEYSNGTELSVLFVGILILGLVCFIAYKVTCLLGTFQAENLKEVEDNSKEQLETSKKISKVAEELIANFDKSEAISKELDNIVKTNYSMIKNISESTDITVKNIEKQTNMTFDINKHITHTEKEAINVADISDETSKLVNESAEALESLRIQAIEIEEANMFTVEATNRLSQRIKKVDGIVKSILEISSNTNLLALNASIEAARVGEAGKGFAVVADEIRKLSEETNNATSEITEILEELVSDIDDVEKRIYYTTDSSKKQNEMIIIADEKFNDITVKTEDLNDVVKNINEMIKGVKDSNKVILDNISELSEASEEVANESQEGLKMSEETLEILEQYGKLSNQIYLLASQLKDEN